MNILWDLFRTFAQIGMFTFGGGYAMISIIEDMCVARRKWISHDEMMNITVIAESTPGPIAINAATYVGFRQAGILGSCFCHSWDDNAVSWNYLYYFHVPGRLFGVDRDCQRI